MSLAGPTAVVAKPYLQLSIPFCMASACQYSGITNQRTRLGFAPDAAQICRLLAILATVLCFVPNLADAHTIVFAGRTWNVKDGTGLGPGPNNWSDSPESVWVDPQGGLHLRIRKVGSSWYCAEVWTAQPTRHGLHRFHVIGRPDQFDPNVVFSPFLYYDDSHEIDIEFSKWGDSSPTSHNSQFVLQPGSTPGNKHTFTTSLNDDYSTHYVDWQPSSVVFKSFQGHYAEPPDPGYLIEEWTYSGGDNPSDSLGLKIHINLWLMNGLPPTNGQEVEIIVKDVDYPPLAPVATTATGLGSDGFTANWKSASKATG